MTEEKKSAIRKKIALAEVLFAAVLLVYLIYGFATKTSNSTIFRVLASILVLGCLVLNDVVEPYLTKVFEEMDDFRKNAYHSYLFWDVISAVGLLVFALTFSAEFDMTVYIGLAAYFVGSKKKREYRGAYLGEVTAEDVEAAKQSIIEGEAKELTEEEAER